MRVVFFGTPTVAVAALEALGRAGHEVALAVTQPDRPAGRSGRPVPSPVKLEAKRRGIAVIQPETLKDQVLDAPLGRIAPELLVVVAYGRLLPDRVLAAAPRGAVNVHFSLLPRYRGAAPVQWAIARGERVTGVTTMQIARRLDAGDILLQSQVPIEPRERAPALAARLAAAGAELLLGTLDGLAAGTLAPQPQDEALATDAPRLTAADGAVDPTRPAAEIDARRRGFDPWPGAWLSGPPRRLRLVETAPLDSVAPPQASAGDLVALAGGGVALVCGDRTLLELLRVQPEGGREMSAADARNGRLLVLGPRPEPR